MSVAVVWLTEKGIKSSIGFTWYFASNQSKNFCIKITWRKTIWNTCKNCNTILINRNGTICQIFSNCTPMYTYKKSIKLLNWEKKFVISRISWWTNLRICRVCWLKGDDWVASENYHSSHAISMHVIIYRLVVGRTSSILILISAKRRQEIWLSLKIKIICTMYYILFST